MPAKRGRAKAAPQPQRRETELEAAKDRLDLSSDEEEEEFSEDEQELDSEEEEDLLDSGTDSEDGEDEAGGGRLSARQLGDIAKGLRGRGGAARAPSGASTEDLSGSDTEEAASGSDDDDDDDDDDDSGSEEEEGEGVEGGEGEEGEEAGAGGSARPKRREQGREREMPPAPYALVGSDSDSEEDDDKNTIGKVPLEWYKHEDHVGYDREGKKVIKQKEKSMIEKLMARVEGGKAWRTLYDPYNGEEVTLSSEEVKMLMRIREGKFPHASVEMYEPYVDWFTRDVMQGPVVDKPEPKRRFVASKHEEKKIVKLVRAIRKGWLKTEKPAEEPEVYLMWGDDGLTTEKTPTGLTYIPPPRQKLPGHEESYRPPPEYVPTEEEKAGHELLPEEERPSFVPRSFDAMRKVPAYERLIKERFERCLDLYLCPRVKHTRHFVDPESLLPKLPKPRDLEPYPKHLCIRYEGHEGPVRALQCDASGQWLATGADDGAVRVWEVSTGRCVKVWDLGAGVDGVAWCPHRAGGKILAAACGKTVRVFWSGVGGAAAKAAAEADLGGALAASGAAEDAGEDAEEGGAPARWARDAATGGLLIRQMHDVERVSWHARGDYMVTVAPTGNTRAVLVHQLSRGASQNPFRKNRGRVVDAVFHPAKPFLFVATEGSVRVYNLASQSLAKKLTTGSGQVTAIAVHPSGDHLVVGASDSRVRWFDMDLSTKPYKSLRYHELPVTSVAFHGRHPLFASASDDGSCHVFHGMVYADLMKNPMIVPVKILRAHAVTRLEGVQACAFHPSQPWVFSGGADGLAMLFVE
ncbi:unnamed protein product [Pedinophyceae sp. YPF-701]|nr:unnamed protein product [Pedinophyceae sp. YPF-701]